MALYKRSPGGHWWTRFTVRGKPIRRSCNTTDRQAAEEYETALRAQFWRQVHLGESVHTWREAVARLKREAAWRPVTRTINEKALSHFDRMNHVALASVDADVTRAMRDWLERGGFGVSSCNRIMAVVKIVLRAAWRWGWLKFVPPVPMVRTEEREPNWATQEQAERLLLELPLHTRPPALFSILTGLRMSNTRDLKWSQVDLDRGHVIVPSSHYKTKRAHGLPLSPAAVDLLRSLPQTGEHVFTYRGEKIAWTFNTKAFRAARERAGITCRWHDLRHTFASWMAQDGASDRVLQMAGGWTSPRMVAKYAHLRAEELRPSVDAVGTIAVTALQIVLTSPARKRLKKLVPEIGIEPTTPSLRMGRSRKKA